MPIEDVISHKRREQETMRGFIEAFCACDIERFLDAAIALTGSDPRRMCKPRSLER